MLLRFGNPTIAALGALCRNSSTSTTNVKSIQDISNGSSITCQPECVSYQCFTTPGPHALPVPGEAGPRR